MGGFLLGVGLWWLGFVFLGGWFLGGSVLVFSRWALVLGVWIFGFW